MHILNKKSSTLASFNVASVVVQAKTKIASCEVNKEQASYVVLFLPLFLEGKQLNHCLCVSNFTCHPLL